MAQQAGQAEGAGPLTPIRRQYLAIKRRFPGAILLFRLGDFYETFDEDARVCARELGIALTSKPLGKGLRVPLAGIPRVALEGYLARLIAKGYKVAIAEQLEDPATAKGLVAREVVRVVTPGTLLEPGLLPAGANNYLAAVAVSGGLAGLAACDVSTGEFVAAQLAAGELAGELARLAPAELLLPEGSPPPTGAPAALTAADPRWFDPEGAREAVLAHFGAAELAAYGLEGRPLATAAAGAVLRYLAATNAAAATAVSRLASYTPGAYMALDGATRRNLELFEDGPGGRAASLIGVLDHTRTPMGARLLRRWLGQPLREAAAIEERLDAVGLFHADALLRARAEAALRGVGDLERRLARVAAGAAPPRELVALRRGLEGAPALREALEGAQPFRGRAQPAPPLERARAALLAALAPCDDVAALIAAALGEDPTTSFEEGGVIRAGFSEALDRLREGGGAARRGLAELERRERERTGIRTLKLGYNRVFGYYLEVTAPNLRRVPADWQRRQTLAGGERFATPELKGLEERALAAREKGAALEEQLFRDLCAQVAAHGPRILALAAAVARLDVFRALGEAAARYGYARPAVDGSDELEVREGRHPVVERALPPGAFVANDCALAASREQIAVVTGPNMSGKSTYLRQVALIALMAQAGSFVPAAAARIGLVDRIFTRVGARDDLAAGRSTFMVEMVETAHILNHATPRSLLLFDEIGRGTSTYDGISIARAVVEYLHGRPAAAARTLFATHYHELTELAAALPRVRNYTVAVSEEGGQVLFLHRIVPGAADRSYGIHVAQLAGLPREVVARAREVLAELEALRDRRNGRRRPREPAAQLPLAPAPSPLLAELAALAVDELTPRQALQLLYELRERAAGAGERP